MFTKPQPHDLESALTLIRSLEPALAAVGYHIGLTGSVLYAGKSDKDLDLMLYPDDPRVLKTEKELGDCLVANGFDALRFTDPAYTNRTVLVTYRESKRIDFFIFSQ